MAGDPSNAAIWADADVYVGPLDAQDPADIDSPFPAAWALVGLLDGGDGFGETPEWGEDADHFAWGGGLVASTKSKFKLTRKFSVLEDNPTTRKLIWPGSDSTKIVVPKPEPVKLGFELRKFGRKKRRITKNYALVSVDGDITETETDLAKVSLVSTIFPDGNGVLFVPQDTLTFEDEDDEPED
ncbi:hypothetical protein [Rhizomonospora bruguierae]|uniref:hypothetical protein n=1 Tax=Rhizomonospora bruguierae TaxID=1581705 RepID=UPI001BCB1B54|nr:hypothetical protein [Micromonospora sp. NBRC 107566]